MAESRELQLILTLKENLDSQFRNVEKSLSSVGNSFKSVGDNLSSLGGSITKTVAPAFALLSGAMLLGVKQSWDQVRAVENARLTMLGFGASVEQVDEQMRQAIAFVRSPEGKLFQRDDILNTQAGLFGVGIEIDKLAEGARTLAIGTMAGNGTFEEFVSILRKVEAEGKVSMETMNQLGARGVFLDESMRSNVSSAQDLLNIMSEVLPVELIANRVNSIDGMMITLRSSFRDLGASILGVDVNTSTFIEGGLGSKLIDLMKQLTDIINQNKEAFFALGQQIATAFEKALPLLLKFLEFVMRNFNTIMILLGGVLALGTTLMVLGTIFKTVGIIITGATLLVNGIAGAISFLTLVVKGVGIAMTFLATNPVGIVIMAIGALILIIVLLIKNWDTVRDVTISVWTKIADFFSEIWERIKNIFASSVDWLMKKLQPLLSVIDKISGFVGSGLSKASNAINSTKGLLGFDSGGIVPGRRGQAQLAVVHGGETILPTHKSGFGLGGGINITLTGNTFMGKEGVAREIADEIMRAVNMRVKHT